MGVAENRASSASAVSSRSGSTPTVRVPDALCSLRARCRYSVAVSDGSAREAPHREPPFHPRVRGDDRAARVGLASQVVEGGVDQRDRLVLLVDR